MSVPVSLRVLIAASAASTVAWATVWVQPLLLAELMTYKNLSASSAGLLITAEMLALSLAAGMSARLPEGTSFLWLALLGTAAAMFGNAMSWWAQSYPAVLSARIICGLGAGAVLTVSRAVVARFPDPDRNYGKINLLSTLAATLMVYAVPYVGRLVMGPKIFPTLLISFLILLPLLLLIPRSERLVSWSPASAVAEVKQSRTVMMIWLGSFIFLIVNSAMWSFYYVIAMRLGLHEEAVNQALAVSILFSLFGSLLASVIGVRFGRLLPFAAGLTLVSLALFAITHTQNPVTYSVAISINMFGIYFVLPYFMGAAAMADPSGRGVAMVGTSATLSFAVGAYLGGLLLEFSGPSAMGWLGLIASVIAMGFMMHVEQQLSVATKVSV